jgi:hypothetical protein
MERPLKVLVEVAAQDRPSGVHSVSKAILNQSVVCSVNQESEDKEVYNLKKFGYSMSK